MLHRFNTFETFIPKNTKSRFKTRKGKQMLMSKAEEMQRFKVWVPFYLDDEDHPEDTKQMRDMFVEEFKKFLGQKGWTYLLEEMKDDASFSAEFRVTTQQPFDNIVQLEFTLADGGFSDLWIEWCGHEHHMES